MTLQVLSTGTAGRRGLVVVSRLGEQLRASAVIGRDRLDIAGAAGETAALQARARDQVEELVRVAETLEQAWPRLAGEVPDPARHWLEAGFTDPEVVAWLEVGVYGSASAQQLRRAGVTPREVGGQYEVDVTLGLAFARGEVSLKQLLGEVDR